MNAYRTDARVDDNGEVHLTRLPFRAGEDVEVIVLSRGKRMGPGAYPLRGVPIEYDRPTDPVGQDDWGAMQ